ncbi:MAG: GNAT family N-acetyltransferase [Desulfovibrionaceae bacterium]|jgi:ribosomal protein S18 acetylase RimI-like enzyme|nr:GNAT family N-acetyltransferase [Desulfovibrionaceae bacterium]
MPTRIEYGPLRPGEERSAVALVLAVFDEHVAPTFAAEGVAEFRRYANPEALAGRLREGAVVLAARRDGELVGVVELRADGHLSQLFVDSAQQGLGIGGELVRRAAAHCRARGGGRLTVNSSPNALGFYRRAGFDPLSGEQLRNGIRFIPMEFELGEE